MCGAQSIFLDETDIQFDNTDETFHETFHQKSVISMRTVGMRVSADGEEYMTRRITIRDIAKHAGVSVGTVSNVLNERPKVDETLRDRVRTAVAELNYRVNVHARGMILRRSFNIGVVIPSLTDPFFPQFASSLEQAIEDRGSHVIIASSRSDASRERAVCESLVAKQIDGLILTPCCRENCEYFNGLVADGLPIVQLGRYFEEIHAPIVRAENFETGRAVVERLYRLGHRRILHLAGVPDSNPDIERARGFRETVATLGIRSGCTVLDADDPMWRERITRLFASDDPPTAVFAVDDLIAFSFLKLARRLGVEVPSDASLVSVGPFFPPEAMVMDLSTYTLDPKHMSGAASELLFSRIDGTDSGAADRATGVVAPTLYVEGETTQSL